jgi:diacylglycerol kinase (ATP)
MPDRESSVAVLANPTAGRGRNAHHIEPVLDRLRSHGLRPALLTAVDGASARDAARSAVAGGVDALVAIGGDGTVHLALQSVAGTDTPLGIVPGGTGNDFATAVGVPADPLAAADVLAKALLDGAPRRVDAARTTDAGGELPWWSTIFCAGFDSAVNERANRMRWPRGPRRYDLAILAELFRLAPREFTLDLDGECWTGPAVLVAIGNTPSYGGGMLMCPAADPTDGLLDVTIVGPISRTTLIRLKPRLYRGTHIEHPAVTTVRSSAVTITASGVTSFADGELLGALPVTVACVPGALRLLLPSDGNGGRGGGAPG